MMSAASESRASFQERFTGALFSGRSPPARQLTNESTAFSGRLRIIWPTSPS